MKILGIAGDAAIRSVQSARFVYGDEVIDDLLADGNPEDRAGNPLTPVFSTDEGAHEEICAGCFQSLEECTCGPEVGAKERSWRFLS